MDTLELKNEIERALPAHFKGGTHESLSINETNTIVQLCALHIASDPVTRAMYNIIAEGVDKARAANVVTMTDMKPELSLWVAGDKEGPKIDG